MACLFAAAHPERVRGLVLYGSYAKRTSAPGYEWAQNEEERAAYSRLLSDGWDWEADMLRRCPSADAAMQAWWARRSRAAATPEHGAHPDGHERAGRHPGCAARGAGADPGGAPHRRPDGEGAGRPVPGRAHPRRDAGRTPGRRPLRLRRSGPDRRPDRGVHRLLPGRESRAAPRSSALVAVGGDPGLAARLADLGGRRRIGPGGRDLVLFDGPATAVRAGLAVLAEAPCRAAGSARRRGGPGASRAVRLRRAARRGLGRPLPRTGRITASSTVRDLLAGSGVALDAAGVLTPRRGRRPAGVLGTGVSGRCTAHRATNPFVSTTVPEQ